MDIAGQIRAAIAAKVPRTSIAEVGKKVGLEGQILSNMLNGRTKIPDELPGKIRKVLNLPDSWPERPTVPTTGRRVSLAGTPMVAIPVAGYVAAGNSVGTVDYEHRTIYVPERLADLQGIGYEVDGESMVDKLFPSDIAVFKSHSSPILHIPMLLQSAESELRMKLVYWDNPHKEWWTSSYNPAFPPSPLGADQILGFLVGLYRYRGTRELILSDPAGLSIESFT